AARPFTWLTRLGHLLRRQHQDTTQSGWTLLLVLLGVTILCGCCIANWCELNLPAPARWIAILATKSVQVLVMLVRAVRLRPLREPHLTAAERQIWSLVPGYYGGFFVLVGVNLLVPDALPLAPVLAVLSGMGFTSLGASIWGWFYVWGLLFFALAVAMVFCAPYGLSLLGLGWFVALIVGGMQMRE